MIRASGYFAAWDPTWSWCPHQHVSYGAAETCMRATDRLTVKFVPHTTDNAEVDAYLRA